MGRGAMWLRSVIIKTSNTLQARLCLQSEGTTVTRLKHAHHTAFNSDCRAQKLRKPTLKQVTGKVLLYP